MGFLDDLKKTMRTALSGEPDLSSLTPKQRARYDAVMADVAEAEAEAEVTHVEAMEQQVAYRRAQPLHGPAGDFLYGQSVEQPSPVELRKAIEEQGLGSIIRQQFAASKAEFSAAARGVVSRLPQGVEDPVEWARLAATERAARDAARTPYRAPDLGPLAFSRIVTTGKTQLANVGEYLASTGLSGRPDLVFGVYRVPDRIEPRMSPRNERGRVVEWEIVHAAPGALPRARPPVAVTFAADEQWIARRYGDPAVLDEDLGALYCVGAGVGPQQCLGIARAVRIAAIEAETGSVFTQVDGVHVLHAPQVGGAAAQERMAAAAPLSMGADVPGVHVVVLNWAEVALVVHPQAQRTHVVPSPFAYLPSTPQELLQMYLEVVGVPSSDCYSAQVTTDEPRELWATGDRGFGMSNKGGELPCADGIVRQRLHGATRVVVAYRDSPEYEVGRQRWAAYQREVLQTALENGTGVRAAIPPQHFEDVGSRLLRTGFGAAEAWDRLMSIGEGKVPPPLRYCFPLLT